MNTEWIEYAEEFTSQENDLLQELRRECFEHFPDSSMLSGFYQGRVLSMLAKMIRPNVVLEIGTYLGYSALCFAEGLAEGGRIITLDINEETNKVARSYAERSPFAAQIDFRLGEAAEIIPSLPETFDLVFIDADKTNYSNYYDLVFKKLREGGFIVADNVLWSGKVLLDEKDESAQALHDFNEKVLSDKRVSNVLLPIRDGLMIVRKESA